MIKRERCRARNNAVQCERTQGHDGTHRAESGQPIHQSPDGTYVMPMVVWL